jgi:hypothetical protein
MRCSSQVLSAILLLLIASSVSLTSVSIAQQQFVSITPSTSTINAFDRLDVSINLSDAYNNPFDTRQIAVDALITDENSQQVIYPCFYFAAYRSNKIGSAQTFDSVGPAGWRLRYSFDRAGTFTIKFRATDQLGSIVSDPIAINVLPARIGEHGFLQARPDIDSSYLIFSNDSSRFIPIGFNYQHVADSGLADVHRLFKRFSDSAAGINMVRFWMNPYSKGYQHILEWTTNARYCHGVGNYSLETAWFLDSIVDFMEHSNISFRIVPFNASMFAVTASDGSGVWHQNPYYVGAGGWLKDPLEFFTDSLARFYAKLQMRYLVARWGWARMIQWELFNEVHNTDGYHNGLSNAWHHDVGAYLRSIDMHHHVITTSGNYFDSALRNIPEIETAEPHVYSPGISNFLASYLSPIRHEPKKPIFIGEFGASPTFGPATLDRDEHQLQVMLWLGFFFKSSAMPWYWYDHFSDSIDGVRPFRALTKYLAGTTVDGNTQQIYIPDSLFTLFSAETNPIHTEDSVNTIMLIDSTFARPVYGFSWHSGFLPGAYPALPAPAKHYRIPSKRAGTFEVRWYSPQSGDERFPRDTIQSDPFGDLYLSVPSFIPTIAFKIYPLDIHATAPFQNVIEAVYPNPAGMETRVLLQSAVPQDATLRMYDEVGREVMSRMLHAPIGRSAVQVDLSGIVRGMYYIRIDLGAQHSLIPIALTDRVY